MKKPDKTQWTFLLVIMAIIVLVVVINERHAPSNESTNQSSRTTTSTTTKITTTSVAYVNATQAGNYLGQVRSVRVHIDYTFTDPAGTEFLDQFVNYASGFVVCIYSGDLGNFTTDPASAYQGDTIDVTGTVSSYGGYFEILNPTKIKVIN